jgi:hypothetical protein
VLCGPGTNHGFFHRVTGQTHPNAGLLSRLTFAAPEKHWKINLFFRGAGAVSTARMLLQLVVASHLAPTATPTREAAQQTGFHWRRLGLPLVHEWRLR